MFGCYLKRPFHKKRYSMIYVNLPNINHLWDKETCQWLLSQESFNGYPKNLQWNRHIERCRDFQEFQRLTVGRSSTSTFTPTIYYLFVLFKAAYFLIPGHKSWRVHEMILFYYLAFLNECGSHTGSLFDCYIKDLDLVFFTILDLGVLLTGYFLIIIVILICTI